MLAFGLVVVCQAAACLGPVLVRHGRAARCFGAMSEAGSEAPSWRPRDATLANTLRPSAKIATSKPHGGGDGPRLAWVVDRRPLQLRVALVIGVDSCLLGVSRSRGNTPAAAYCSAEPDESHKLAFLGTSHAPRARRLSNPPPRAEGQFPAIPTSVSSFPGTRRRRLTQYCGVVLSARGSVTWCPRRTTHRGYS